jgi:putative endonuclease
MAAHNEAGTLAETMTSAWLEAKGYVLLARNFRYRKAEIDLIMVDQETLLFIEVKFRSGIGFGFAEGFVDRPKKKLLIQAADHFIHSRNWKKDIRFDIVSVYKDQRGVFHFRQFKDAFY